MPTTSTAFPSTSLGGIRRTLSLSTRGASSTREKRHTNSTSNGGATTSNNVVPRRLRSASATRPSGNALCGTVVAPPRAAVGIPRGPESPRSRELRRKQPAGSGAAPIPSNSSSGVEKGKVPPGAARTHAVKGLAAKLKDQCQRNSISEEAVPASSSTRTSSVVAIGAPTAHAATEPFEADADPTKALTDAEPETLEEATDDEDMEVGSSSSSQQDEEEESGSDDGDDGGPVLSDEEGSATPTVPADGSAAPTDGSSTGATQPTKIVADRSGNKPNIELVSGLPSLINVSVSPFAHRMPSVVFRPADKPITADPEHRNPEAFAFPSCLGHGLVPHPGRRKRIARKKKFGKLLFCLPDGAVRFSSVISIFQHSGLAEGSPEDSWSVKWCKRVEPEDYALLKPYQRVNHFPGTWSIGRKDNLHKRLTSRLHRYGPEHYGFFPKGFLLPNDWRYLKDDMERTGGSGAGRKKPVDTPKSPYSSSPTSTPTSAPTVGAAKKRQEQLYILKPVASACGRGVRLLHKAPKKSQKGLVQQYVHNPMLIQGYKFDLRIYVVVTSYDPLRLYVYEDGLVRFASSPYPDALAEDTGAPVSPSTPTDAACPSMKDFHLKKKTAHLTNFSINKHNKAEFVTPTDADEAAESEKASKWTLSSVKEYFAKHRMDWTGTWARIEDVIIKTILCAEPDAVQALRRVFPATTGTIRNCFELYGFDVLLKKDLTPVLMEVNIMPSLSTKCSLLDQRVKSNMIADMLTMVGGYSATRRHSKMKAGDPSCDHPFIRGLKGEQLDIVMATEEEFERRMHFKRLFPTATAYDQYRPFFAEARPRNHLLQQWERCKAAEGVTSWSQYVAKTRIQQLKLTGGVALTSSGLDDDDVDDEEGGEEEE